MKDLFSKITFGFLMAQFLPGCIVVVAVSMLLGLEVTDQVDSVLGLMDASTNYWFKSEDNTKRVVFFLFLSTGAGMTIHGLNWMMVGFVEHLFSKWKNTKGSAIGRLFGRWKDFGGDLCALRDNIWHRRHIMIQIVLGPFWMVAELLLLLMFSRGVNDMLIDENVGQIPKDKMDGFQFLQDFYLNFSQFFLHTSYALTLFLLPAILFSGETEIIDRWQYAIAVYLLASYFFLVGRVQISSLFNAESKLKSMISNKPREPETIIVQVKHHEKNIV